MAAFAGAAGLVAGVRMWLDDLLSLAVTVVAALPVTQVT